MLRDTGVRQYSGAVVQVKPGVLRTAILLVTNGTKVTLSAKLLQMEYIFKRNKIIMAVLGLGNNLQPRDL